MSARFLSALAGAFALAFFALSPAVDRLADAYFSWHMAQHLVLLFAVPFLLLAAEPFRASCCLTSKRAVASFVRATRPLHLIAHPIVAMPLFVGTLWITHFSGMYEFALEHEWAHVLEHGWYFAAGLLFWAPVLAPPPLRPLPFPLRIAYLLFALPQGALLAFALAGSHRILYEHYARNANALADQSNAAAVMWIGGGLIVFTAFLSTFGAWALRESAAQRESVAGGFS